MRLRRVKQVVLGVTLGVVLGGAASAIAGNGVGAVFNLGQTNNVNAESTLKGTTNTPQLTVQNLSTGAAALGLAVNNKSTAPAISGGNGGAGIGFRGTSTDGVGVLGRHNAAAGTAAGVEGQTRSTSSNAVGVKGIVTPDGPGSLAAGVFGFIEDAATFSGAGVRGQHAGNGYGGYFESQGEFGTGIFSDGGFYGGYFYADQPGSTAVYASGVGRGLDSYSEATSGPAYGVFGDADSSGGGHGVMGRADGGTGVNYGVRGEVLSADGIGGFFQNHASGNLGIGVQGFASNTNASGVPSGFLAGGGEFTGGNGVIGAADRSSGYGVLGIQGPGSFAGYFSGNVHVAGTLSKSAGSFKIDHPLDPENKTLSHSFVESPDMKNIYDGTATLDDDGEATVNLPGYFGALNRDFRYQLTPIGAAADLYIAEEIADNRFAIAGGEPGMKVSWQVTGIRKDAYANANRISVEQDKPAAERGEYLNPGAFGAPRSEGIAAQTSGNARPAPVPVKRGDRRPRRP